MNEAEKGLLRRYQKALLFMLFEDSRPPARGFLQVLKRAFQRQPKGITW